MNAKIVTRLSVLALATALVAGCASKGQGANTGIGAGVGTAIGAVAGDLFGGKQGAEIGALAGAAAGAGTGYNWDKISGLFGDGTTSGTGVQTSAQPDGTFKLMMPGDLSFAPGSDQIKPSSGSTLDQVAQTLVHNPGMTATINGYTDNSGNSALNQRLSARRATAVATYLTQRGVSPDRLTTQGFGENNALVDNSTAFNRAKNRRVEIVLHAAPPQSAQPVQQ